MSEPAAKISKIDDNLLCDGSSNSSGFKVQQNEKDEEIYDFIVRLCHDVLLEALLFGNRRRLTKLERVGRRFHLIIENFFKERPCLCLGFQIYAGSNRAIINGIACPTKKSPSLNKLTKIPMFLRFDNVRLWYNTGNHSIEAKSESIDSNLLPIKLAFKDSDMVKFAAGIARYDRNHFSDHSKLLDYIRNRFLPICNSSRRYKFQICFFSDRNSDANVIASILEMDEIKHCSNVEIVIICGEQKRLPVENILNWLEKSGHGMENTVQDKLKFLKIHSYPSIISTATLQYSREMVDYFKTKLIEAKFPVQPFTFRFHFQHCALGIKAQTLTNKNTREELSINHLGKGELEIKRARMNN